MSAPRKPLAAPAPTTSTYRDAVTSAFPLSAERYEAFQKRGARRADDADLDVGTPASSSATTAEMIASLLKSLPAEQRASLMADINSADVDGSRVIKQSTVKQEKLAVKQEPVRPAAPAPRSRLASPPRPAEEEDLSEDLNGYWVAASGKGKVRHTYASCGAFPLMPVRMRDAKLKVCLKCAQRDAKNK